MKYLAIQHENVKSRHVASIITTNVRNGVPFHGRKPRIIISIHQSPHQQLSTVRPGRSHLHTVLSNVLIIITTGLFNYPFVANSFTNLLSLTKTLNSENFFFKYDLH